jgi:hypothetical protein
MGREFLESMGQTGKSIRGPDLAHAEMVQQVQRLHRTIDGCPDETAETILTGLHPPQRERLIKAIGEVERLLAASAIQLRVCDPRHDAAKDMHGMVRETHTRLIAPTFSGRKLSAARVQGVRRLRLETKDELHEAMQMYINLGFREVEPFNDEFYADHWFEKLLTDH